MKRVWVPACALCAAGIVILTAFPSASTEFTPGTATAGDPYFPTAGDGGYRADAYILDLTYTPGNGRLAGDVTMTATATQNLSRFDMDLRGLTVSRVTVDGERARVARTGDKVVVTPARGQPDGDEFTVVTHYAGTPGPVDDAALGSYGWVPTARGAVVVSEPDGASTWYPVNDTLDDKATYTIRVTVPTGLTVLSDGVEVASGTPRPPAGETTFTWEEDHPMASYLATVAIGDYAVRTGTTDHGIPVVTAVDPAVTADSAFYPETTAALDWASGLFGPYPFESAGGVVASAPLGYGLETQTRPIYAGFDPDPVTIAHEISHQWFGDSVTPSTWRDIWLNEGFATYAEWLWTEQHGGETAAQHFADEYAVPADSPIFTVEPGDPGRDAMFGPAVDERGAMTLEELRKAVGDPTFFAILRDWAARYRYGNADTADFVALADRASGKSLGSMFHTWLYTTGKPSI